jgi:hypothetical protein
MRILLAVLLSLIPLTVQAEYLGDLSENDLNPDSIFNDIGVRHRCAAALRPAG